MAGKDPDDLPEDWSDFEKNAYGDVAWDLVRYPGEGAGEWQYETLDDPYLENLFHEALFDRDATPDERHDAREELREYLADEYGIDFDEEFDWEDWRDWYDGAA